jgi:hypothetical protein
MLSFASSFFIYYRVKGTRISHVGVTVKPVSPGMKQGNELSFSSMPVTVVHNLI